MSQTDPRTTTADARGRTDPDEDGIVARIKARRESLRDKPGANLAYRIGVGVVGGLVLLVGIIAIPYPGPGWAIVIAGLAILSSEFTWAQKLLGVVKRYYTAWTQWLGRQPKVVQGLVALGVGVIVVATLWLIGALALVGGWFGFEPSWLQSPLGF